VSRHGDIIQVTASGTDDTNALQCALDASVAARRSITVDLGRGTFVSSPLHAKGFSGRIVGQGAGHTVLTNPTAPVHVTATNFYANEPSAANPWASMIAFVGGDFEVADLSVHVRGQAPTSGWSVFGIPTIRAFAHGFVVVGAEAHATFERVAISGEAATEPVFLDVNLGNAIYFEGFLGLDPPPLSGSFTVRDSDFDGVAFGTPIINVRNARVRIENNRYRTTFDAFEVADSKGLDYVASGNRVQTGGAGLFAFDGCIGPSSLCGVSDSKLLFVGNEVTAPIGFQLGMTIGAGVRCAVLFNRVRATDVGVELGAGTHDCLVLASGSVRDLGTNNRVVLPH
jgi:hypothetical protein